MDDSNLSVILLSMALSIFIGMPTLGSALEQKRLTLWHIPFLLIGICGVLMFGMLYSIEKLHEKLNSITLKDFRGE